ncbi:MAG TPA: SusC/RagA family TonB-linked outer membrane protein [Longimicrobiales bacterium]
MSRWVSRISAVVALALGTAGGASAQATGTITGSVVDAGTGQPLAGVQIHIPATGQGTLSNPQGRFLIPNVAAGEQTVRAQNLGYADVEQVVTVPAGGTVTVNFRLEQQAIQVEGIVVTALGIEREERSLGFAVQNVDNERLEQTPAINVVEALKGTSAGVRITTASSMPGASRRITIRGEGSFTGDGQPLWVIDGVPISMDTDAQRTLPITAGGRTGALDVGQAGNRGMDLDPNNIESISVLRGAAATALYGARAAAGAIVVTTKKGTPGQSARFTVSTRMQVGQPLFYGKQTNYTAGYTDTLGIPRFCNALPAEQGGWCEEAAIEDSDTYWNWGPHKDSLSAEVLAHEGRVRMVDPREDYYRNSLLTETSINANGGISGGGSYNLGASFVKNDGIDPGTALDRLNLNANVALQLTERLQSTTMVMYSHTQNEWHNVGYYSPNRRLVLSFPANRDIRPAWICDGQPVPDDTCGQGVPVMFGNNDPHFEWLAKNNFRDSNAARWIVSQTLRYDILPNLSIQNRLGMDTYNDIREERQGERPWRTAEGRDSGGTLQSRARRLQLNDDLILSLSGTPVGGGVTVSGLVGANVNMNQDDDLAAYAYNITIPDLYNLSNFENEYARGTLTRKTRLVGIYSQITADYRDWAFLTLTGRNDWSSTLPKDNNAYFYPSASLGIIFTDALGWRSPWLQYGKLRLSVAKVGNDAPPYRLATTYREAGGVEWPYKGQLGFAQSNGLGNPALKPESTTEYEVGLDLRGLSGRGVLNVSYYDRRSYDQIFDVPASAATGYGEITRNAGSLRNKGIEVSLQTVPIQTSNFRWDLQFNWSRNRSTVESLAPGVESIFLAGYSWPQVRIMEGEPYGVIWGYGYARDENGNRLIYGPSAAEDGTARDPVSGDLTEPGYPIWDDELKVIGNSQPDWLGSVYTGFQYGPVNLTALFTGRHGGDILNFDLNYTIANGSSSLTAHRGDEYVFKGINADTGEPNDQVLIRDREFWQRYGAYNHHENFIEDGSFIRLQSVSLSYTLPQSLVNRLGLSSMQIYGQGSNLHIWTDYSNGDPEGSNFGSTNAGGTAFHFFLPPPMRSFSIGMRANF